MELLIGAAILVSISSAAILAIKRRKARRQGRAGAHGPDENRNLLMLGPDLDSDGLEDPERPLHRCQPGDVIIHDGRDWLVDRVYRLAEGSRRWAECLLMDGDDQAWMLAPDDEEPFLGWAYPMPGAPLDPPSSQVEVQGRVYSLARRGRAVMEPNEGELRFWDYKRPGTARIWHRQEGNEASTYLGQRIPRHMITMLPGS